MALNEAEKEEIILLHERGLNLAEIARVMDRHWQTVRKYLMKAGLLKHEGTEDTASGVPVELQTVSRM